MVMVTEINTIRPVGVVDDMDRDGAGGIRITGGGAPKERNRAMSREVGNPCEGYAANMFIELARGVLVNIDTIKFGSVLWGTQETIRGGLMCIIILMEFIKVKVIGTIIKKILSSLV